MKPRLPVLGAERRRRAAKPPAGPTDLLTRAEVCEILGFSRWTLIRWGKNWERLARQGRADLGLSGAFPPAHYRDGRCRWSRWQCSVVEAWIEARRVTTTKA